MDQDTTILLGYGILVVVNRAAFMAGLVVHVRPLFYLLQLVNIAACSFFLGWGMPEFREDMQVINYMLGGCLLLRTVKNNQRYGKLLRNALEGGDSDHLARRQAVLDKLKSDDEKSSS